MKRKRNSQMNCKKKLIKKSLNDVEDEIHIITNLATTSALNAKINAVKGKIPNITNLVTAAAFTTVENKIPNVSNLF